MSGKKWDIIQENDKTKQVCSRNKNRYSLLSRCQAKEEDMINRSFQWLGWILLSAALFQLSAGWPETEEYSIQVKPEELLEVILDIDVGEVTVKPGDFTDQCLVIFTYDPDEFSAKTDYKEQNNRLKIKLDKKGWKSSWDGDDKEVRAEIHLPKEVEMKLDSRVKAGEVFLDVGGLSLRRFRLSLWAGEVSVHFDEPNPVEMELLEIKTNIGELRTSHLGNARFKKANINGGIGEIDVDLTGDLLNDAMAKVDLDIGEASVILPEDRSVRLSVGGLFGFMSSKNIDSALSRRGRNYYSEDFSTDNPLFSVRITPGLGELNVDLE